MKRDKVMNAIGLLLLFGCFLFTLKSVFSREIEQADPDVTVISFSHWQLESGVREAWDEVVRQYEAHCVEKAIAEEKARIAGGALGATELEVSRERLERLEGGLFKPVKIKQVAIPEKIYVAWMKSRLVGEAAPHIIAMQYVSDEMMARYFLPLSEEVAKVNPHNEGTMHEGKPWRSTFVDGMEISGYNANLMETYYIPFSMHSYRIFYNRQLFRNVLEQPANAALKARLGSEMEPRNWQDFSALCQAIDVYVDKEGRDIIPMAGSRYNSPMLMELLYNNQTSKLKLELNSLGRGSGLQKIVDITSFLEGRWSLDTPEVRDGLLLMQEVSRYMKPGFTQLTREDALFDFLQGSVAMTITGAWDAPSIYEQAYGSFDIGIFEAPMPDRSDPRFGKNVLGPISEAHVRPGGDLGVVNFHPKHEQEIAMDFLRFAMSYEGNKTFSHKANWLPVISGVPAPPTMVDFEPRIEGYPPGFLRNLEWLYEDTRSAFDSQMYLLVRKGAPVEDFIEKAQPLLAESLRKDLDKSLRAGEQNAERMDTTLAVNQALHEWSEGRESERAVLKRDILVDGQHALEVYHYYGKAALEKLPEN